MAHETYPHLFSPVKIGNATLRNRVVMAAMGMSQSDGGFVNRAVINHYAARANGGVGAVVVEVTCVDAPLGLNTKGMLVIDDKYIPGMAELPLVDRLSRERVSPFRRAVFFRLHSADACGKIYLLRK